MAFNFSKLARILNAIPLKNTTKNLVLKTIGTARIQQISTTNKRYDLMEFFDAKENWGANEVKSGRAWRIEELRLKSNTDLHKLWFVLLKERNMLLTMEEECKEKVQLFPSPERIDKIEESMENLETVVRERNAAYHELETGETGERPGKMVVSALGLNRYHRMHQHLIPKYMNKTWWQRYGPPSVFNKDVRDFLVKYREKLYLIKRKRQSRNFNHVVGLLKRFPNMDMQALQEKYPDVDVEKAKNSRKCRGHFAP